MSPIKGLSDRPRQLPRLGKIRLGEKVQGDKNPYPRALDYFKCPPEVQAVFGDKPKVLDIAFPVDDIDTCASVWYRCYSSYRGLTAKGDGEYCTRLVDLEKAVDPKTGALPESKEPKFWPIARKDAKKTDRVQITCDPEHCEEYGRKQCRMILNLQFLLPEVPGIGVWQVDSSSVNSIRNVLDGLDLIKRLGRGRMALIPLKLSLIPKEVDVEGVKKTIHVLQVIAPQKIAQLLQLAALPAGQALLPEPDDEAPDGLVTEEAQDGQPLPDGESRPIIIEVVSNPPAGTGSSVNLEDAIFGEKAAEERDRKILWKEILELMKDTEQPTESLISWFRKKQNITVKEIVDTPPGVPTMEMLATLRDNLKAYKVLSKKANVGTDQRKLI